MMSISKPQYAVRSDVPPVGEPVSNSKVKDTEVDERSWTITSGVLLDAGHHLLVGNFHYLLLQVLEPSVCKVL